MHRPRIALALSAGATLLLSCDAPSRAVAPRLTPNAAPSTATAAATDPLRATVAQVWGTNASAGTALANYDAARKSAGDPIACAPTAALLRATLDAYRDDKLSAKAGTESLMKSVQGIVVGLSAFCGRVAPTSFPLAALSLNGAAVYLPQAGGDVATIDGLAGIGVPTGALPGAVLLTITRRLDGAPGKVLGTSLESGPFYDIGTFPHVGKLGKPVNIELVQTGPSKALSTVDLALGHGSSIGGTEIIPVVICRLPRVIIRRVITATYLQPATPGATAGIRLADGAATAAAVINDTAGTAGGCGGANDLSPFGFIEVRRPNFDAKPVLGVAYTCGTTFTVSNRHSGDLVAVWRTVRRTATQVTVSDPATVLVRAGKSVTLNIGTSSAGSELRLQYGATVIGSAALPATLKRCT